MIKRLPYLILAFLACVPLLFTSCDDDDDFEVAAALEGTWHGVISTDYYYSNYGQTDWETEFRFYNYGDDDYSSTSGEGVEIDYDPDEWSDYSYYEFKYEVAYGNIYFHFSNGEELVLRNYSLTENTLDGDFETVDGEFQAAISLDRTSYWPWTNYAKATRASGTTGNAKRVFPKAGVATDSVTTNQLNMVNN